MDKNIACPQGNAGCSRQAFKKRVFAIVDFDVVHFIVVRPILIRCYRESMSGRSGLNR